MPQNVAVLIAALVFFVAGIAVLCPSSSLAAEKLDASVVMVIKRDELMGSFKEPAAIYFDESKQRLYVADSGNKRLVSFDEKFEYLSELSDERFGSVVAVAKAADGNFYILDASAPALKLVNLKDKSVIEVKLTGVPQGAGAFVPWRFALDKADNLYVVDRMNARVLMFTSSGKFTREFVLPRDRGSKGINHVNVGSDGSVYAVDSAGQKVYVFDANGKVRAVLGQGALAGEALLFPSAVASDSDGLIYVADKHAGKILVYGKTGGRPLYAIGMRGFNDGQIYAPIDITVDSKKRVFILDGARISVLRPSINPARLGR
ncbi:MAG: NHL repeat-containing protein [Deltaproteobacteria bacterium]|nr:NHL repeat-containing protein [Deltaproteobacteria bacterium]